MIQHLSIHQDVGAGSGHNVIPDLKWAKRHLPIREVCQALGLCFGAGGMIHCWHPERHQNGDRTPSVAIRTATNRVRCFGCGTKMLTILDLIMDVTSTDISGAVHWLEAHFVLQYIPKRKHLADRHAIRPYLVGREQPIELLVKSGLWAELSAPAQRIIPVLLSFAEHGDKDGTLHVTISYRAVVRYSGMRSFATISKALSELIEIGWLTHQCEPKSGTGVLRDVNSYKLMPHSDSVVELANKTALENRELIKTERELRSQKRRERRDAAAGKQHQKTSDAVLQSTSLYRNCSVERNGVTEIVSGNSCDQRFAGLWCDSRPKPERSNSSSEAAR